MYLELSTLTVDIEHRLGIDRKDHLPPVVFFLPRHYNSIQGGTAVLMARKVSQ